jgi:hypothetical protein
MESKNGESRKALKASPELPRRSIFLIAADWASHLVPPIWVRMYGRDQKGRLTFQVIALWAKIRLRQWHLQALNLRTRMFLFFAVLRYHLLCFKHFGRFRLAIFVLKIAEHFKAVLLALFTHPSDPKCQK